MKIFLIFITRAFLTMLSLLFLLSAVIITLLLVTGEAESVEFISVCGILFCAVSAWYIGKPQMIWWKKFLNENESK